MMLLIVGFGDECGASGERGEKSRFDSLRKGRDTFGGRTAFDQVFPLSHCGRKTGTPEVPYSPPMRYGRKRKGR